MTTGAPDRQGLKSLGENLKLAQFCRPVFQAGTERRGDTENARLKGGRYKTVPIQSSHTDSKALLISDALWHG